MKHGLMLSVNFIYYKHLKPQKFDKDLEFDVPVVERDTQRDSLHTVTIKFV